jgi:predicted nucleotidyltransferase
VITQHDIAQVVGRIVDLYDPDTVYLFGSYAKGNAREDSDVDLLVVKPTTLPRSRRGRDVVAMLSGVGFSLDVLFLTPQEVEAELAEPYSLITTIMPTAKPVYQRAG